MTTFIHTKTPHSSSMVWLDGPGSGLSPGATRVLKDCAVWLVDEEVGQDILDLAEARTQILPLHRRGHPSMTQLLDLRLMTRYVRTGYAVARVRNDRPRKPFAASSAGKGDMPELAQPGAGLPLSRREIARGVTLVAAADGPRPEWKALARSGMTLVCRMGAQPPVPFVDDLLAAGFPPDMPVRALEHQSCAAQRCIDSTLQRLPRDLEARQLAAPSAILLRNTTGL